MSDFDQFWAAWPNRKAKLDAIKAYAAALKIASAADILAGVHRYVTGKPDYADWKLPAGWLRDGRWMDEYDEPAAPVFEKCAHVPTCNSPQWHLVRRARERGDVA